MPGDFFSFWALGAVRNYEFMSVVIQLTSLSSQICKFHEGEGQTSVSAPHCISSTRTWSRDRHLGTGSKHLLNEQTNKERCEELIQSEPLTLDESFFYLS